MPAADGFPEREEDTVTVVVVDDHTMFRHGLAELIAEEGLTVLGHAHNGEEGIRLAERLRPDVVVMDLHMPGMGGIEATHRLVESGAARAVVVMTVSSEGDDVRAALQAGARGYVVKDAPPEEMAAAIRAAAAGATWLSYQVAPHVLTTMAAQVDGAAATEDDLTDRERDVLRLLAAGKDNAEIGADLYLSTSTVKSHVSNILAKLGVENRVQAAVYATERGLL